jgi:hypothetical protein
LAIGELLALIFNLANNNNSELISPAYHVPRARSSIEEFMKVVLA